MHLFNHLEPSLQFHCAGVRVFLETGQQFALHAIERVLPYLPGARGRSLAVLHWLALARHAVDAGVDSEDGKGQLLGAGLPSFP